MIIAKRSLLGPIVRVAPDMLSVNDPLDVPQIYHKDCDKNDFWTHGALGEHPPLIQTLGHKEHSQKRKIIASMVCLCSRDISKVVAIDLHSYQ